MRSQPDALHSCRLARLQNKVSVGDRLADVGEPEGATHAVGIDLDERIIADAGELDEVVGVRGDTVIAGEDVTEIECLAAGAGPEVDHRVEAAYFTDLEGVATVAADQSVR